MGHSEYISNGREPEPRFEYNPGGNIFKRMLVGIGVQNKLASSKLVSVPYRSWIRWVLVLILALIAIVLTPQLLPKWLGFNWSTPSDLCQAREIKLQHLQAKIEGMANLHEATRFMQKAEMALGCIILGINSTWDGLNPHILYPQECIPANAIVETETQQFCIPASDKKVCVDDWGLSVLCKTIHLDGKCQEIKSTDEESVRHIAELNAERQYGQARLLAEAAQREGDDNDVEQVLGTADKQAEKLINRLLTEIDVASNLYIVYTMLAIIIGTPIMIYKREMSTRVVAAAFGLQKANFIVLVVVILTVYDSAARVVQEANFPQLMANYRNDPCYLDPDFSKSRLDLIRNTCGIITTQNAHLDELVANMTTAYYDAGLCEVCEVPGRRRTENPELVAVINNKRLLYDNATEPGYIYPGLCNASAIANATATPPESGVSWGKALLGSGILAQILLKGILATWIVHLVSYFEPMTMHRGMVEIYGIREEVPGKDIQLTPKEEVSVYKFAKDKHIMPLIFWSLLLIWELIIIVYSAVLSKKVGGLTHEIAAANSTNGTTSVLQQALNMTCDGGKVVFHGVE